MASAAEQQLTDPQRVLRSRMQATLEDIRQAQGTLDRLSRKEGEGRAEAERLIERVRGRLDHRFEQAREDIERLVKDLGRAQQAGDAGRVGPLWRSYVDRVADLEQLHREC